jgi:hypothetical protein
MREAGERLYTPTELAEQGIMSHVKQWQERKSGRLRSYRIGRKVLYGQRHLDAYFAMCEQQVNTEGNMGRALTVDVEQK